MSSRVEAAPLEIRPLLALMEASEKATIRLIKAQRDATLAPIEKEIERGMATAFRVQGKAVLAAFEVLKGDFPAPRIEEARSPEKLAYDVWDVTDEEAKARIVGVIKRGHQKAFTAAITGNQARFQAGFSFGLDDPRAVQFLENWGAKMVSAVNDETERILKHIVTRGVEAGDSYDRVAKTIKGRFKEFAIGKPQHHIQSRAHLGAVTESANAYGQGNYYYAREIEREGIHLEKKWDTSKDDLVSDGCQENEDAGWIPIGDQFPSGDDCEPRFPGCRCAVINRVSEIGD